MIPDAFRSCTLQRTQKPSVESKQTMQKLKTTDLSTVAFVGIHGTSSNTVDTIPKKTYRVLTNLESQMSSMSNLSFTNFKISGVDYFSSYILGNYFSQSESGMDGNNYRHQTVDITTSEQEVKNIINPNDTKPPLIVICYDI